MIVRNLSVSFRASSAQRLYQSGVVCLLLWGWLLATPAAAQQFVERTFQDAQGSHKYQVFIPAGYSAERPPPAILFLHGAGERGTDGKKQTLIGLGPFIKAWGARFPFLAVFPQAEDTDDRLLTPWTAGQPDGERALKILDAAVQDYRVDPRRVALVGWSMGGYGAWSLGAAYPERWSAVVAISGGGDPEQVARLKDVPVWAFHGARDALVPVAESRTLVSALQAAGGKVNYTEFPRGGHVIFQETFANENLLRWLADPVNGPQELAKTTTPLQIAPPPFVPALDVPDVVGIRLGNEALNALSYAAPQMIPPGMLQGRLNDMFDSSTAQGRNFSVRFSGISYYGQLERVQIRAVGTNRVNVQLGLRNITLSIAGTSVSGARQSAQAGPINIGIGHNRTVWLSLDVAPTVENRQLRLRLLGSSFSIPPDTYYVTQPAGVSVQGLGMTRERVTSSLVSGLYGARSRVENEVRAIVPSIVQELERQLKLTDPGPIVSSMWPLPVFEPNLRAFPTQVSTDADGISVVLGITASSFDIAAAPGQVQTVTVKGVSLADLKGVDLGVAVSPGVMQPLSKLLIDDGLARINLLDLPEKSFHRLADRSTLEEVLPGLKDLQADVSLRSVLVFRAPLEIALSATGEQSESSGTAIPLAFRIPRATVEVSTKAQTPDAKWTPFAAFDLQIGETLQASLQRPNHEHRLLDLAFQTGASIEGTGRYVAESVPPQTPLDAERFVSLFRESWTTWTQNQPTAATVVPDVEFARTKLRMQSLGRVGVAVSGSFEIPTIKLTNLSEEPFVYETKGPYSDWGGPYTLKPGESQEYKIPYPLTYRRSGGKLNEVYTLFTGTHSEYRVPLNGGPPQLFTARE